MVTKFFLRLSKQPSEYWELVIQQINFENLVTIY